MTNAMHTPGPWVTSRVHAGEGYVHSVRQNIAGQPTIAMVWDDNDNPIASSPDARLIAAAPDLLAALEKCLPIINAYRRIALGDGDIAASNARAAIAKAKGE